MASDKNMKSANETYGGFLTLIKWGTVLSALATILVVILLVS